MKSALLLSLYLSMMGLVESPPNVIVIITDDQGHGDLSIHGNKALATPNMDRIAKEGARLTSFHVSPVCSPTRACLLTGRYNYRGRVVDTYIGRSIMDAEEVTLAEHLSSKAGYSTGIVDKWHLGDNYPFRAIDQGFQHALVLKGGGLAQPAGPPGDGYFDPVLWRNGVEEKSKGYCTDIFVDESISFINAQNQKKKPFLLYLAFNAPHDPLQTPEEDTKPFLEPGVIEKTLDKPEGHAIEGQVNIESTAKIYGMITRIDRGVGRILETLAKLQIEKNTIVIFLTDNGPQQPRYKSGLRGLKGTTFDGGIKVACFIRWPKRIAPGTTFQPITAHIDLTPTLLEACGVKLDQETKKFDGISLLPWLDGKNDSKTYPERTLFFQWHRGDAPEPFRGIAVRESRYKLVRQAGNPPNPNRQQTTKNEPKKKAATKKTQGSNADQTKKTSKRSDVAKKAQPDQQPAPPPFLLFDMRNDPYEKENIADKQPEIVERLKKKHQDWLADVSQPHRFVLPRIQVGTSHETTSMLTRQDWRGPKAGWGLEGLGHWELEIGPEKTFDITAIFPELTEEQLTVELQVGEPAKKFQTVAPILAAKRGEKTVVWKKVSLPLGKQNIQAVLKTSDGQERGAHYIELRLVK